MRIEAMDNNNWLQQILLLGLGTTSLVAERVKVVSEQWVKEGKIDPEQAKLFVDDLMQQLKLDPANFEAQMQRMIRNTMQDLGVPRQGEMDELRGRIDRLERQIRELENKTWR
jgi:polyhydroxyalkanoate synthesis regulator phasin